MAFAIFFIIDDCIRQCLFMRLTLKYLFFDCSCLQIANTQVNICIRKDLTYINISIAYGQHSIDKTRLCLSITPYASHRLIVCVHTKFE